MEAENQHNEQTETSTEDTNIIQSEVDINVVNQTDEEMDNDEVVLLVDSSSKRLDKQNLKKLKKMSDKLKEKKAKDKQKEKEKKAKKKKKQKAKKEKAQKKLKEKKAKKKASSKKSKKKSKKK